LLANPSQAAALSASAFAPSSPSYVYMCGEGSTLEYRLRFTEWLFQRNFAMRDGTGCNRCVFDEEVRARACLVTVLAWYHTPFIPSCQHGTTPLKHSPLNTRHSTLATSTLATQHSVFGRNKGRLICFFMFVTPGIPDPNLWAMVKSGLLSGPFAFGFGTVRRLLEVKGFFEKIEHG